MKINLTVEVTNLEEFRQQWLALLSGLTIAPVQPVPQIGKWKFSDHAIDLLASPEFEDTKLTWYPDSNGYKTIGAGHLITKAELASGKINIGNEVIKWNDGLTEEQAHKLLLQDLSEYELCINRVVNVVLNQNQYDALVIFCFNIGEEGFEGSTCLKLLNQGQYDQVPTQMRRWNKSYDENHNLIINPGLVNRREKEIKIWNGDYV